MVSRQGYTQGLLTPVPFYILDRETRKGSLMDHIETHSPAFAKLIHKAGIRGQFNHPQANYTVFAPCALYELSDCDLDKLGPGHAHDMIRRSVINGRIKLIDLQNSPLWTVPTIKREDMLLVYTDLDKHTHVDDMPIVEADICANNGVLHLITGFI